MANFEIAYRRTEGYEGRNVYTITPGDAGGETWSGISRRANPAWGGWKIIDAIPNKKHNQVISTSELTRLKLELYRQNYWNPVWGDKIKEQVVANDMYDTAVNMGVGTSIKLSQRQFGLSQTGRMTAVHLNKLNSVIR